MNIYFSKASVASVKKETYKEFDYSCSHHNNSNDDNTVNLALRGYKKAIFLFAAFLIVIVCRTVIIERIIINGDSMYPSLVNNDVCLAKKYRIDPKRYDIVIANVMGQDIIKRIIGLPGETLEVQNGKVYINDVAVDMKYDFYTEPKGLLSTPFTLAANEYFLMGDNRTVSYDSREFGSVKSENIKGIIIYKIFPFTDIRNYSR